jgi:diguanylate cyclase (GGDEF)-like protein
LSGIFAARRKATLQLGRRIEQSLTGGGRHELPVAQFLQLRRQIPALYFLLSVNSAALAFTHRNMAPILLVFTIPAMLICVSIARLLRWVMPVGDARLDVEYANATMRRTEFFAGIIAVAYVSWALALDQFGGPYEHGHVAIFIAVTVMGCILCLGYLPRAALIVCVIVTGTFLSYCVWRGSETLLAVGINIALVTFVILKVMRDSFDGFVRLEDSQRALRTERIQANRLSEENARLAHSDPLTSLPNRRYFFARLDAMLARAQAIEGFCVGVIDLDRFKPINDSYGHAQGDRLLQVIGERLMALCTPELIVARLGGDEFGLIIEGSVEIAERIGQRLCDEIQRPVLLGETLVSVGCSGGLAAFPTAGRTAQTLFDCADFALYHAKKHKRGACVRFSDDLEKLIRSEMALDAALQAADLDNELSLVFQPIFSTATREVVAVEALARWTSPRLGLVPPEELIATAERLGLARTITLALFSKVLTAFARLPGSIRLSFNLSASDICDPGTVAALIARMARSGIDPGRLIYEITETSLVRDIDNAQIALKSLRESGAAIALDDFGTGYSSLSSLHQLPIDIVKIDRSFAARLDDPVGRRLIGAIRGLASSLSLDCVFEGIETEMQLVEVTLAKFHHVQGYFLARPASLDAVLDMIGSADTESANAA